MSINIELYKKLILRIIMCMGSTFYFSQINGQIVSCKDSLKTNLIGSASFHPDLPFQSIATADNGTVLFQSTQNPQVLSIMKLDPNGNPLWSKDINRGNHNGSTPSNWSKIEQLSSQNYLISTDTYQSGCNTCTLSSHLFLDSIGQPLFQANYLNILGDSGWQISNSGPNQIVVFAGIRLAKNGGGITVSSQDSINVGGNSYAFNPRWTNNYSFQNAANTSITLCNLYVVANYIYIGGIFSRSSNSGTENGIWILKLDANTGSLFSYRSYTINNALLSTDSLLITGEAVLYPITNRHFLYTVDLLRSGNNKKEIGYIRFDEDLNILNNPIVISSTLNGSSSAFPLISSYIKAGYFLDQNDSICYYALIDSTNEIYSQYKISNSVNALSHSHFTLNNNGVIGVVTPIVENGGLFFQEANISPGWLDNSGCISIENANFVSTNKINCSDGNMGWAILNTIEKYSILSPYPLPAVNNTIVSDQTQCVKASICDSLKIHGKQDYCLNDSSAIFTVSKNKECLNETMWTAGIDFKNTISKLNDTAVSVKFIGVGSGFLIAHISKCNIVDSFYIVVAGPPLFPLLGNDTLLCKNTIDTLRTNSIYKSYLWQDGSENSFYIVKTPGQYSLIATDFCGNISFDTIKINYTTDIITPRKNVEICNSQDAILVGDDGYTNYQWQPLEFINGNASQKTVHIILNKSIVFSYSAINQIGCKVSDSVDVIVTNCLNRIVMPNAFTPNNDGVNDQIKPTVFGILTKYEFSIYNRWGQQVFFSDKQGEGWNGTVGGVAQGTQSFVWICKYDFMDEPEKIKHGSFLLIR